MSNDNPEVKKSRIYSEEFKKQIVALRQSGRGCKELCKEYGLGKNTVTEWVKELTGSEEKQKIKALEQKVRQLEMQVDILRCLVLLPDEKKKR